MESPHTAFGGDRSNNFTTIRAPNQFDNSPVHNNLKAQIFIRNNRWVVYF